VEFAGRLGPRLLVGYHGRWLTLKDDRASAAIAFLSLDRAMRDVLNLILL